MNTHKPKVFADFHHASLLNSLIMLFEGRMGGELYRPIGMEWAEQGFWKVYDHPATQAQFLGIGGATPDGSRQLNEIAGIDLRGHEPGTIDVYLCKDIDSGKTNRAITFDGFMNAPFELVIASIPQHIEPFRRLCDLHPSHPKLIYQIGNAWNINANEGTLLDGVMSSANLPLMFSLNGHGSNPLPVIKYHQEFDLNIFNYEPPRTITLPVSEETYHFPKKIINSFVNCFSEASIFQFDWLMFQTIENLMPEWQFGCYGGQCRDGSMDGSTQLAQKMKDSRFIWHMKYGGDGYGHVIHNAAAVGRPLIVRKEYYSGKLANDLLIDGETCITIDGLGVNDIVNKIKAVSDDQEHYYQMCENLHKKFEEVVNFDKEFVLIKEFLEKL